jgi:hypothetical protein
MCPLMRSVLKFLGHYIGSRCCRNAPVARSHRVEMSARGRLSCRYGWPGLSRGTWRALLALSKAIFSAATSAPGNGGIAASSFEVIADRARSAARGCPRCSARARSRLEPRSSSSQPFGKRGGRGRDGRVNFRRDGYRFAFVGSAAWSPAAG